MLADRPKRRHVLEEHAFMDDDPATLHCIQSAVPAPPMQAMAANPEETPVRRRVVLVLADAQAYSAAMEHDETGTWRRIVRSKELFRKLVGDYGGRVADETGDAFLALFPGADEALRFAVEIQREMRSETVWGMGDQALKFRIGVNIGEVIEHDGRIFGHAINATERIQRMASAGGICLSEAVRMAITEDLGVRLRSLGRPRLKNLAERIELFAVEAEGIAAPASVPDLLARGIEVPCPAGEAAVVVLPLANISGDPVLEHLCAGLAGEIIGELGRFRNLLVIAQHSAFLFKHSSLPQQQVARQLGARYLVTGSVLCIGAKLRLRVQLSEAESGNLLWSECYDGALSDIFAFQDDVVGMVAARLEIQISAAEQRRLHRLRPPELDAYGMVLRGQELSHRYRRDANLHARHLFELAAEMDPDYGRPYAGMSRTFNLAWRYRWADDPQACLDRAIELAAEAIDHDHLDSKGYAELGFAHLYRKEHSASLTSYERAITLNPNDADVLVEYADALTYDGVPERAIEMINRAMRLNPYYPDWYLWYKADAYNAMGRSEDVIATVRRMRDPAEGRRLLAANYAHLGMEDEARGQAQEVLRLHPDFSIAEWAQRPPYRHREPLERYIEGLRRAGLPERT